MNTLQAKQKAQIIAAIRELPAHNETADKLESFASTHSIEEFWNGVLFLTSNYPDIEAKLATIQTIQE